MRLFCCCGGSDPGTSVACQPCPAPIDPGLPVRHRVTVQSFTIYGYSRGSGALSDVSDSDRACMAGNCDRQIYQRKALYFEDFTPTDCPDLYPGWCENMYDEEGPSFYSDGLIGDFIGCQEITMPTLDIDGSTEFTSFGEVVTCVQFECNAGYLSWDFAPPGAAPVYTLVNVVYTWPGDSFTINGLLGDCSIGPIGVFAGAQLYFATYARPIAAGERYALGTYQLVAASWAGEHKTLTDDGFGGAIDCPPNSLDHVACRAYADALPSNTPPWTLPETIYVSRIN